MPPVNDFDRYYRHYIDDANLELDFFRYSPEVRTMIYECLRYKGEHNLRRMGLLRDPVYQPCLRHRKPCLPAGTILIPRATTKRSAKRTRATATRTGRWPPLPPCPRGCACSIWPRGRAVRRRPRWRGVATSRAWNRRSDARDRPPGRTAGSVAFGVARTRRSIRPCALRLRDLANDPLAETLARVAQLVKPGGCFAFNVPSLYLGEADEPGGGSDPNLVVLAARLADGRRRRLPPAMPRRRGRVRALMREAGFSRHAGARANA
jgi:hypothetical protein